MSSPLKSHSEHLLKPRASFAFPLDLSHFYFNQSQIRLILTNITIYFRLILSCKYAMTFFEKCTSNFDLKSRISNNNRSLHKVFKPIIEKPKFSIKATKFIHVLIKHIYRVFQIWLLVLKTVLGL